MTASPLAGRGIVVTRPAHQAEPLAELIRAAGGQDNDHYRLTG